MAITVFMLLIDRVRWLFNISCSFPRLNIATKRSADSLGSTCGTHKLHFMNWWCTWTYNQMTPQVQPRSVHELHAFGQRSHIQNFFELWHFKRLYAIHICHENRPSAWKELRAPIYKINMWITTIKNVFLYSQDSSSSICQSANTPSSFLEFPPMMPIKILCFIASAVN